MPSSSADLAQRLTPQQQMLPLNSVTPLFRRLCFPAKLDCTITEIIFSQILTVQCPCLQLFSPDLDERAVMSPYQAFPISNLFDDRLIIIAESGNSTERIKRETNLTSTATTIQRVNPEGILNQSASLGQEAVLTRIGDGQVCNIGYAVA